MITNQPFNDALGYNIIEKLQSGTFHTFRFIVAYAKTSGVNRLLPYMREFKDAGGKILGVVGIDQNNTTYEALVSLLGVCDELYIFHSEDSMKTFHVKAYALEGETENWVTVGSNNLTAGGLFSNYEASISLNVTEEFDELLDLFNSYTDLTSPCCKRADLPFINSLLDKHYVQKEKVSARQQISEAIRRRSRRPEDILFGRDSTASAPSVPAERVAEAAPAYGAQATVDTTPAELNYLVRYVPRAGDRSQQVHFTLDILHNYFNLNPGDSLSIQQLSDIYTPHPIENRIVVFSARNRNVKIEVAAAEILNHDYPEDENKRPILIFKKVNPSFFEYMLLMEGDPGYDLLNERLTNLPWHYKSLKYEIIDADTMLDIWGDCPLV